MNYVAPGYLVGEVSTTPGASRRGCSTPSTAARPPVLLLDRPYWLLLDRGLEEGVHSGEAL
jgi:hypothetical protein